MDFITLLGSARGMENGFDREFRDLATNSIFLWAQSTSMPNKGFKRGRRLRLKIQDAEAIKRQVPEIAFVAPRNVQGVLNPEIKAQTAIHYVLGVEHDFLMWERPFRFTTELYYKDLKNLIPYEIDNVRIRYYAKNNSNGYATGIDFKINGEFVKGVESWASLSFMKTEENLVDDFYYIYYDADGNITESSFSLPDLPARLPIGQVEWHIYSRIVRPSCNHLRLPLAAGCPISTP